MMNHVLITGDSWAELAESQLEPHCPNTVVEHFAEGGKTAQEMVSDVADLDSVLGANYKPDHIWLSIGGNDFLGAPNCEPDSEQASNNLLSIINTFTTKYPDATILLTGYGVPSEVSSEPCITAEVYEQLELLFVNLPDLPPSVQVVLVSDLFGGALDNGVLMESDSKYFADPVHLNDAGYERLFKHPPVSAALGCQPDSSPAPTPVTPSSSSPTVGSQAPNSGADGVNDSVIAPLLSLICVFVAMMKSSM